MSAGQDQQTEYRDAMTDRVFLDLPIASPAGGLIDAMTLKAHTSTNCADQGLQCVNGIILALDVGMYNTTLMASRCRSCGMVMAWFNVADLTTGGHTP